MHELSYVPTDAEEHRAQEHRDRLPETTV